MRYVIYLNCFKCGWEHYHQVMLSSQYVEHMMDVLSDIIYLDINLILLISATCLVFIWQKYVFSRNTKKIKVSLLKNIMQILSIKYCVIKIYCMLCVFCIGIAVQLCIELWSYRALDCLHLTTEIEQKSFLKVGLGH